jgi:5-methylcytosine-specific restriction endonuclease McrBC GTP-binding regulatory subunit McrB
MGKKKYNSQINDGLIEQLEEVLKLKKNLILQGAPGTGKTYIAKKIAERMIGEKYETSEQFKIVQFHPSYTYEDFVRGINLEIKKDTDGNTYTTYEAKNKILGSFAKIAKENWDNAQKPGEEQIQRRTIARGYDSFIEKINNVLFDTSEEDKEFLRVAGKVNIDNVEDDGSISYDSRTYRPLTKQQFVDYCFCRYYKKEANPEHPYMNQDHLFKGIYDKFIGFVGDEGLKYDKREAKQESEKPFILIIDEINRANLPMVLGELLYALEYRKKPVQSMYSIEDDKGIILPPNLYIIGTMNTADRSAGHIDYAIRRRFAFEYILPKDLSREELENKCIFETELFNEVQSLFDNDTWLSEEFDKRDVAIGHSYFITNKDPENGISREMRIKYEIRPLLEEYVKDGVLKKDFDGKRIQEKFDDIFNQA